MAKFRGQVALTETAETKKLRTSSLGPLCSRASLLSGHGERYVSEVKVGGENVFHPPSSPPPTIFEYLTDDIITVCVCVCVHVYLRNLQLNT